MTGEPYIPEKLVVHLGRPGDPGARNITIDFPYYIKNVASSEIYPTWPEDALKANIYAIISYTLNRYYTEWYRSQGHNFDITSSIQFDHTFIENRDIFEPISLIVDDIFNNFIRREGHIEPLFTAYCDGRVVVCDGLHQWGSLDLANKGYSYLEILKYYYGDDIYIVFNAPVRPNTNSYPGTPLTLGTSGNDVARIQRQLNRVSNTYPAMPKIVSVDGIFGADTRDAVLKFQEIFNLSQTGVVDKSTWYKISYIYNSVKKLSDLYSEGLTLEEISLQFPEQLTEGDTGPVVSHVQYFLEVIGAYYNDVFPVEVTGIFDGQTVESVKSFQKVYGLPETGIVDEQTWNDILRAYMGIVESVPVNIEGPNAVLFPGLILTEGMTNEYVRILQVYLSFINQTYPNIPAVSTTGYFGPLTRNSVTAFQQQFGIQPTGSVGAFTWNAISNLYFDLRLGYQKRPGQYPGYVIG